MKLNMTALVPNTWSGAEMVMNTKRNLIEAQIKSGDMIRLPCGKVIITMQGANAAQAQWDAEYADVTISNNARLVNSLVAFKRN